MRSREQFTPRRIDMTITLFTALPIPTAATLLGSPRRPAQIRLTVNYRYPAELVRMLTIAMERYCLMMVMLACWFNSSESKVRLARLTFFLFLRRLKVRCRVC